MNKNKGRLDTFSYVLMFRGLLGNFLHQNTEKEAYLMKLLRKHYLCIYNLHKLS